MRGRAEAEQSDALAGLNTGDAQAAKTDDAGTEKRGSVQIIERCGEREDEIGAGESVLRVSARDAVSGERGSVTKILHVSLAIGAGAVSSAEPGDANARAERNLFRGAVQSHRRQSGALG